MKISEVSKRYSRALYETAKASKIEDKVLAELRILQQAFSTNKEIFEFVNSPMITPVQKSQALKNALSEKFSSDLVNFMLLLATKNRLSLFAEISNAFEAIIDEDQGVVRGIVRSADILSSEARIKIEETVKKVVKKKVILSFVKDPNLLGGMVAQVGGWTFDDSLDSHLIRLGEDLNRRAN